MMMTKGASWLQEFLDNCPFSGECETTEKVLTALKKEQGKILEVEGRIASDIQEVGETGEDKEKFEVEKQDEKENNEMKHQRQKQIMRKAEIEEKVGKEIIEDEEEEHMIMDTGDLERRTKMTTMIINEAEEDDEIATDDESDSTVHVNEIEKLSFPTKRKRNEITMMNSNLKEKQGKESITSSLLPTAVEEKEAYGTTAAVVTTSYHSKCTLGEQNLTIDEETVINLLMGSTAAAKNRQIRRLPEVTGVHLLPSKILYSGPAAVSTYFLPQKLIMDNCSAIPTVNTSCRVIGSCSHSNSCSSISSLDDGGIFCSYFRGRKLLGKQILLPGATGFVAVVASSCESVDTKPITMQMIATDVKNFDAPCVTDLTCSSSCYSSISSLDPVLFCPSHYDFPNNNKKKRTLRILAIFRQFFYWNHDELPICSDCVPQWIYFMQLINAMHTYRNGIATDKE